MRSFKVLKPCYDKRTNKPLTPGMILVVDEARAKELEKKPAYVAEIKEEAEPEEKPAPAQEEKKKPGRKKKA